MEWDSTFPYRTDNYMINVTHVKSKPSTKIVITNTKGARCSSVVRAFAHGAMGRRIDHSCGEPIELFLVPASAPRLV